MNDYAMSQRGARREDAAHLQSHAPADNVGDPLPVASDSSRLNLPPGPQQSDSRLLHRAEVQVAMLLDTVMLSPGSRERGDTLIDMSGLGDAVFSSPSSADPEEHPLSAIARRGYLKVTRRLIGRLLGKAGLVGFSQAVSMLEELHQAIDDRQTPALVRIQRVARYLEALPVEPDSPAASALQQIGALVERSVSLFSATTDADASLTRTRNALVQLDEWIAAAPGLDDADSGLRNGSRLALRLLMALLADVQVGQTLAIGDQGFTHYLAFIGSSEFLQALVPIEYRWVLNASEELAAIGLAYDAYLMGCPSATTVMKVRGLAQVLLDSPFAERLVTYWAPLAGPPMAVSEEQQQGNYQRCLAALHSLAGQGATSPGMPGLSSRLLGLGELLQRHADVPRTASAFAVTGWALRVIADPQASLLLGWLAPGHDLQPVQEFAAQSSQLFLADAPMERYLSRVGGSSLLKALLPAGFEWVAPLLTGLGSLAASVRQAGAAASGWEGATLLLSMLVDGRLGPLSPIWWDGLFKPLGVVPLPDEGEQSSADSSDAAVRRRVHQRLAVIGRAGDCAALEPGLQGLAGPLQTLLWQMVAVNRMLLQMGRYPQGQAWHAQFGWLVELLADPAARSLLQCVLPTLAVDMLVKPFELLIDAPVFPWQGTAAEQARWIRDQLFLGPGSAFFASYLPPEAELDLPALLNWGSGALRSAGMGPLQGDSWAAVGLQVTKGVLMSLKQSLLLAATPALIATGPWAVPLYAALTAILLFIERPVTSSWAELRAWVVERLGAELRSVGIAFSAVRAVAPMVMEGGRLWSQWRAGGDTALGAEALLRSIADRLNALPWLSENLRPIVQLLPLIPALYGTARQDYQTAAGKSWSARLGHLIEHLQNNPSPGLQALAASLESQLLDAVVGVATQAADAVSFLPVAAAAQPSTSTAPWSTPAALPTTQPSPETVPDPDALAWHEYRWTSGALVLPLLVGAVAIYARRRGRGGHSAHGRGDRPGGQVRYQVVDEKVSLAAPDLGASGEQAAPDRAPFLPGPGVDDAASDAMERGGDDIQGSDHPGGLDFADKLIIGGSLMTSVIAGLVGRHWDQQAHADRDLLARLDEPMPNRPEWTFADAIGAELIDQYGENIFEDEAGFPQALAVVMHAPEGIPASDWRLVTQLAPDEAGVDPAPRKAPAVASVTASNSFAGALGFSPKDIQKITTSRVRHTQALSGSSAGLRYKPLGEQIFLRQLQQSYGLDASEMQMIDAQRDRIGVSLVERVAGAEARPQQTYDLEAFLWQRPQLTENGRYWLYINFHSPRYTEQLKQKIQKLPVSRFGEPRLRAAAWLDEQNLHPGVKHEVSYHWRTSATEQQPLTEQLHAADLAHLKSLASPQGPYPQIHHIKLVPSATAPVMANFIEAGVPTSWVQGRKAREGTLARYQPVLGHLSPESEVQVEYTPQARYGLEHSISLWTTVDEIVSMGVESMRPSDMPLGTFILKMKNRSFTAKQMDTLLSPTLRQEYLAGQRRARDTRNQLVRQIEHDLQHESRQPPLLEPLPTSAFEPLPYIDQWIRRVGEDQASNAQTANAQTFDGDSLIDVLYMSQNVEHLSFFTLRDVVSPGFQKRLEDSSRHLPSSRQVRLESIIWPTSMPVQMRQRFLAGPPLHNGQYVDGHYRGLTFVKVMRPDEYQHQDYRDLQLQAIADLGHTGATRLDAFPQLLRRCAELIEDYAWRKGQDLSGVTPHMKVRLTWNSKNLPGSSGTPKSREYFFWQVLAGETLKEDTFIFKEAVIEKIPDPDILGRRTQALASTTSPAGSHTIYNDPLVDSVVLRGLVDWIQGYRLQDLLIAELRKDRDDPAARSRLLTHYRGMMKMRVLMEILRTDRAADEVTDLKRFLADEAKAQPVIFDGATLTGVFFIPWRAKDGGLMLSVDDPQVFALIARHAEYNYGSAPHVWFDEPFKAWVRRKLPLYNQRGVRAREARNERPFELTFYQARKSWYENPFTFGQALGVTDMATALRNTAFSNAELDYDRLITTSLEQGWTDFLDFISKAAKLVAVLSLPFTFGAGSTIASLISFLAASLEAGATFLQMQDAGDSHQYEQLLQDSILSVAFLALEGVDLVTTARGPGSARAAQRIDTADAFRQRFHQLAKELDPAWKVDVALHNAKTGRGPAPSAKAPMDGIHAVPDAQIHNQWNYYTLQDGNTYRLTWDGDGPYWRVHDGRMRGDRGPSAPLMRQDGRWQRRLGSGGLGGAPDLPDAPFSQSIARQVKLGKHVAQSTLDQALVFGRKHQAQVQRLGLHLMGWAQDASALHGAGPWLKDYLPAVQSKLKNLKTSKDIDYKQSSKPGQVAWVEKSDFEQGRPYLKVVTAKVQQTVERVGERAASDRLGHMLTHEFTHVTEIPKNVSGAARVEISVDPYYLRYLRNGQYDITAAVLGSLYEPSIAGLVADTHAVMARILADAAQNPAYLGRLLDSLDELRGRLARYLPTEANITRVVDSKTLQENIPLEQRPDWRDEQTPVQKQWRQGQTAERRRWNARNASEKRAEAMVLLKEEARGHIRDSKLRIAVGDDVPLTTRAAELAQEMVLKPDVGEQVFKQQPIQLASLEVDLKTVETAWDAVLRVDYHAGVMGPGDLVWLTKNTSTTDFRGFLGNGAGRPVTSLEQVGNLPVGYRVVFLDEQGQMLHAMLTLGDGKLAGWGNHILKSDLSPEWSIIDLTRNGILREPQGTGFILADNRAVTLQLETHAPGFVDGKLADMPATGLSAQRRSEMSGYVKSARQGASQMVSRSLSVARQEQLMTQSLGQALAGWAKADPDKLAQQWQTFQGTELLRYQKQLNSLDLSGLAYWRTFESSDGAIARHSSTGQLQVSAQGVDDVRRHGDVGESDANLARGVLAGVMDTSPGQLPWKPRILGDGSLDLTDMALQSLARPLGDGPLSSQVGSVLVQMLGTHGSHPTLIGEFLARYRRWKTHFADLEYQPNRWRGRREMIRNRAALQQRKPPMSDGELDQLAWREALDEVRARAESNQLRLIYGGAENAWQSTRKAIDETGASFTARRSAALGKEGRDVVFDLQVQRGLLSPHRREALSKLPAQATLAEVLGGQAKKLRSVADLQNMTPGYALCLITDGDQVRHTLINVGDGQVAGLNNGIMGGSDDFSSFDLGTTPVSAAGEWQINGQAFDLYAQAFVPEFRIEPIRLLKPLRGHSNNAEMDGVLADFRERYNTKLNKPAGECYFIMTELKTYLSARGFTDFKYRGMFVYARTTGDTPANHFVLLAVGPGGSEPFVFDLTSGQFANVTPGLVMPENAWRHHFGGDMAIGDRVVKYQDFSAPATASRRYDATSPRPPETFDPEEFVLTLPAWYKQLKAPRDAA